MPKRTALGRGLDALIPAEEDSTQSGGIRSIPIDQITPNPQQPRTQFNPEELAELASSIREHGILQPLIASYDGQNNRYILIAGERRWLAARQAGLEVVPVLVRQVDEQQRLELALIENLQREDLNPLEAAEAYHQLIESFHLSHDEISTRVGKSRVAITNTLRLLKLPATVKQALLDKKISEGHARALLTLPTTQAQTAALQTILNHELSVRQTEELVRKMMGKKRVPVERKENKAELNALEEQLRQALGTRVNIQPRQKGGGTITIHYYSNEELDAFLQRVLHE